MLDLAKNTPKIQMNTCCPKGHISCTWVPMKYLPGWPSWFSDRPEKLKLWKGHWDLPSNIRFNRFHEEKSRIALPIRGLTAILVLPIASRKKKHKLGRRPWRSSTLSSFIEFHSGVLEEKSKMRKPYDYGRMPGVGRTTDNTWSQKWTWSHWIEVHMKQQHLFRNNKCRSFIKIHRAFLEEWFNLCSNTYIHCNIYWSKWLKIRGNAECTQN